MRKVVRPCGADVPALLHGEPRNEQRREFRAAWIPPVKVAINPSPRYLSTQPPKRRMMIAADQDLIKFSGEIASETCPSEAE